MSSILKPSNRSYREFHSTETALLRVITTYCSIWTASESLSYYYLTSVQPLKRSTTGFYSTVYFGISGHAHSWLKSYLHHRFQSISIHGGTSKRFEVKYSVPHGSCLGPLSFVLYASKLFTIIERHLPDVRAHADDTLLYISFNVNAGEEQSVALENMQRQRLEAIWQA